MKQFCLIAMLGFVIAFSGCTSVDEMAKWSDEQLGQELMVARFQTPGFGGYEKDVREALRRKHTEWPDAIKQACREERVLIGMTRVQVGASWGSPTRVNTLTDANGEHIAWTFGTPQPGDNVAVTWASIGRRRVVRFGPDGRVSQIED